MLYLMPRLITVFLISFILTGCNTIDGLLYEASGDGGRDRAQAINGAQPYNMLTANCKMFGVANVEADRPYCLLYVANIRKDEFTLYASDNKFSNKDELGEVASFWPYHLKRYIKTERDLNLSWAYDQALILTREQMLELNKQGAIVGYHSMINRYVEKAATEELIFYRFDSHTRRPL